LCNFIIFSDSAVPCENNVPCEPTESLTENILRAEVTRNENFSFCSSLNTAARSIIQNSETCGGSITSSFDSSCALDTVDNDINLLSCRCDVPSVECTSPKVGSFTSSEDLHCEVMSPDVLTELQNEFFEDSDNNLEAELTVVPPISGEVVGLETARRRTGNILNAVQQQKLNVKNAKGITLPANQKSIRSFFVSTVPPNDNKLSTNLESISCRPGKVASTQPNNPISRLISAVVSGAAKLCGQVCDSRTSRSFVESHKAAIGNIDKYSTVLSARSIVSSSMAHDHSTVVESHGKTGDYAKKCPFYKRIPST